MIYEILIRGKSDGTVSGSHVIDFDAAGNIGAPRPILDADWPAVAADVNGALIEQLAARDAEITALKAEHASILAAAVDAEGKAVQDRLDALVQAGQAAHAAGDLATIGLVLDQAYAYTASSRRAKLEAQLAQAQAALAALPQ